MQAKITKIVMSLIALALALALAFFAPPIVKLKEPALIVVILIGVVAMIYSFIEFVNDDDE